MFLHLLLVGITNITINRINYLATPLEVFQFLTQGQLNFFQIVYFMIMARWFQSWLSTGLMNEADENISIWSLRKTTTKKLERVEVSTLLYIPHFHPRKEHLHSNY